MRAPVSRDRVLSLLQKLGDRCRGPGRVYLTGGSSAVLYGWRETTIDVDLCFRPEPLGIFEGIPSLKDELNLNLELAAPDDFVPALPGWESRSQWIANFNEVDFFHFDFYTQALSKLERDHAKDRGDVDAMVTSDLLKPRLLLEYFEQVTISQWIRYPAIEPDFIHARILKLIDRHAG